MAPELAAYLNADYVQDAGLLGELHSLLDTTEYDSEYLETRGSDGENLTTGNKRPLDLSSTMELIFY